MKNLAREGKAYMFLAPAFSNASKVIDGITSDVHCPISYLAEFAWWRVEFTKLVEVYSVMIVPGKFYLLKLWHRHS